MTENIKRDIDLKMAQEVKEVKHRLEIDDKNDDTKYNIFYDIYTNNEEKFLYIKMEEYTCSAPFYYNRSYTVNDLHGLHSMFKGFEKFDLEDFLPYFKDLFDKGKIKLSFCDPSKERIKMKLDTIYFSKNVIINFELYREMIPTQKDNKMIELYFLNKNKIMQLKKLKEFLCIYGGTQKEKQKIREILKIIDDFGKLKVFDDMNGKEPAPPSFCTNLRKKYILNLEKGNLDIYINLKNIYEVDWNMNKYKLVYDEENSNLKFSEIVYPMFDILKGQDGDIVIKFNKDDLKSGNKYICKLFLKVEDQKMDNSDIPLNIKVK